MSPTNNPASPAQTDRFSHQEIAAVAELVVHPGFRLLLEALAEQNALISSQLKTALQNDAALNLLALWRAHSSILLVLKGQPHVFLAEINERRSTGELTDQMVDENTPDFRKIGKVQAHNPYHTPQPPPPPAHPSNLIPFPPFPPKAPPAPTVA